nr:MAG TPA: hypothetical protein [Caudoviricetes sp.]
MLHSVYRTKTIKSTHFYIFFYTPPACWHAPAQGA